MTGWDSEGVNFFAYNYDTGHDNGGNSNGNEDDNTDASAVDTANDDNSAATFVSLFFRLNAEKYWRGLRSQGGFQRKHAHTHTHTHTHREKKPNSHA